MKPLQFRHGHGGQCWLRQELAMNVDQGRVWLGAVEAGSRSGPGCMLNTKVRDEGRWWAAEVSPSC
jgi:hypothetical protein